MSLRKKSVDYHDYVIKNGKFIGEFEDMYQNVEDPWNIGEARDLQYDLSLYLLRYYNICPENGKILDIGSGNGAFTARLREAFPNSVIDGIDISPTAVRKASEKYCNMGINFSVFNLEQDYYKIGAGYDLIIMSQLIWYILPEIKQILAHLVDSVLNEGGCIFINQAFYKPEEQKYGKEIISSVEDLLSMLPGKRIALLETNKGTNHNALILVRKECL